MSGNKHDDQSDDKEVNLGIIITPMLDMAFQLLAFFVMTYHPSALEGHIDGKLLPPEKAAVKSTVPAPADPSAMSANPEPDIKEYVRVAIKSVNPGQQVGDKVEGQPTQILVQTPIMNAPETVADTDDTLESGLKKLHERLKQIKEENKDATVVIKLQPDANLKHAYVVAVWNVCRVSGYENISFVAPSPDINKQ